MKSELVISLLVLITVSCVRQAYKEQANGTSVDFKVCPSFDYNFYDQWNHVVFDHWPSLSGIDSAYVEERINIYIFFSNNTNNKDNIANVTMDLKIVDPHGKKIIQKRGVQVIEGKPEVSNGIFLANTGISMKLDRNSISGNYKVITSVRDKVGRQTIRDTSIVRIIDSIPQYHVLNDSAFFFWIENYYLKPDPKSAISAIDFFLKNKILHNDSIFTSVFYFFDLVIGDNPFIGDQIILKAQNEGKEYQSYVAMLLKLIKWDSIILRRSLPLASQKIINQEYQNINPIMHAVYKLDQNPIVYTFYYSGSYNAIKVLAESMWSRDIDSLPDSVRCKKCETPESLNAFKSHLYYKMSKKELERLYDTHVLARGYLQFIYQQEELKPVVKEELGKIIARIPEN